MKEYYADLCFLRHSIDLETECMFGASDKKEVDWRGLYCRRDVPVTMQALMACIKESINEKDELR